MKREEGRGPGNYLHRAVSVILDGFDLNFPASHLAGRVVVEAPAIWQLLVDPNRGDCSANGCD